VTHGDVSFGPSFRPVDRYCWLRGSNSPAKVVLLKGILSEQSKDAAKADELHTALAAEITWISVPAVSWDKEERNCAFRPGSVLPRLNCIYCSVCPRCRTQAVAPLHPILPHRWHRAIGESQNLVTALRSKTAP
jgi:hypothetical protein